MEPRTHSRWHRAPSLGLAVTLAQVGLAVATSGQFGLAGYETLFCWDGFWYESVVKAGYFREMPEINHNSNTAFFPGFPLVAASIHSLTGFGIRASLLMAAQLGCWGMWTYVFLFAERWHVPRAATILAVALIACHPAAFYLVSSYSESLFLFGALGFLYWSERGGAQGWSLAAMHGIGMTATRFVGLPLVAVPLMVAILNGRRERWLATAGLAVVGGLGCGIYFAYCHWQFGAWDMYIRANEQGWGVRPDYLAAMTPRIFRIHWPNLRETAIDPNYISRLAVPVTVIHFAAMGWLEWKRYQSGRRDWANRIGFYIAAALLFYIPVAGHVHRQMYSMIRFVLCVQVMLALAAMNFAMDAPAWAHRRRLLHWAKVYTAATLVVELALAYRFTHGLWVA